MTAAVPASREDALTQLAARLREALGDGDLPRGVVERAAADPLFLHQLVAQRGDVAARQRLLAEGAGPPPKWAPPASLSLVLQAGMALARWSASGFGTVDDSALARRRGACRQCPHLTEPGQMLLQKLAAGQGGKVCGLCSCAVDKKTMLPTESCPAPDPRDAALSRWGEPFVV